MYSMLGVLGSFIENNIFLGSEIMLKFSNNCPAVQDMSVVLGNQRFLKFFNLLLVFEKRLMSRHRACSSEDFCKNCAKDPSSGSYQIFVQHIISQKSNITMVFFFQCFLCGLLKFLRKFCQDSCQRFPQKYSYLFLQEFVLGSIQNCFGIFFALLLRVVFSIRATISPYIFSPCRAL